MSLKERILDLASKDVFGNWGRIILKDAPVLLYASEDEITRVIREEIKPEREVRFHSDNLIQIRQDSPIKPTTITWSLNEDTSKSDFKPLTDKEIEEHMNAIYTPYIPPRRKESEIEATIQRPTDHEYEITQEDINEWAYQYAKKIYPISLTIDPIMNAIRRKLPTAKHKKIREMAQIALRYVLDRLYDERNKGDKNES